MRKQISNGLRSGKTQEMWTVLTNTLREQIVSGHGVRFEPRGFADKNGIFHLQSVDVFLIEKANETESLD